MLDLNQVMQRHRAYCTHGKRGQYSVTKLALYFKHKTCTHGIALGNTFYTEHVAHFTNKLAQLNNSSKRKIIRKVATNWTCAQRRYFFIESTCNQDGPPPRALHVPKVSQGTKSVYSQLSTGIIHTFKLYVEKAQL